MSAVKIRAALEIALNAMSPTVAIAWENSDYTPPAPTTPYQIANVLFAEPRNAESGRNYQELGYMQVKLMYPPQIGTATAAARAELLRSTFYRGASFTNSGVTVQVQKTPEIMPGRNEDGRFAIPVKIPFMATIP